MSSDSRPPRSKHEEFLATADLDTILAYTKEHYGTAEVAESGVDISQLRAARQRTPAERLAYVTPSIQYLAEIRHRNRRRGRSLY